MQEINRNIQEIHPNIRAQTASEAGSEASERADVEPHHIFDLVAGTSTGGLIALMLGKLGLTVEQCIEAYRNLAGTVFGKRHMRSRANGGLAPSKYSGSRLRNCVRDLLKDHNFHENLPISSTEHQDRIAW